jgi:hypothetical protein
MGTSAFHIRSYLCVTSAVYIWVRKESYFILYYVWSSIIRTLSREIFGCLHIRNPPIRFARGGKKINDPRNSRPIDPPLSPFGDNFVPLKLSGRH